MNIPILLIQVISFLASFILYSQKPYRKYFKLFNIFLAITVIVEIVAWKLSQYKVGTNLLYSFFTAFEFEFYVFIIRLFVVGAVFRKILFWVLIIYPLLVTGNIFFIQVHVFHTITYSIGCLLVVGSCINYFLELFRYPKSVNLLKEPAFWISSGLLFFYCCTFPLIGLWNYLSGMPIIFIQNIRYVFIMLNIFLYSLFSVAFLCRLKFRKPIPTIEMAGM